MAEMNEKMPFKDSFHKLRTQIEKERLSVAYLAGAAWGRSLSDSHAEQAPKEEQEQEPQEETQAHRAGCVLEAAVRELLIAPNAKMTEFRAAFEAVWGLALEYNGTHYSFEMTKYRIFAQLMMQMFPERFPDEQAAQRLADCIRKSKAPTSNLYRAIRNRFRGAGVELPDSSDPS